MSYQEAYREPYTKYPNRYTDVIKPCLTGTQRDICDVVIRMTHGWHKTTAEISNTVFARKANKSKQGIIKAKKQLSEMGILVVLQEGGGSRTNEYMLDLWYDDPGRSVKASMIRQEEQLLEMENLSPQVEQEDIPELVEAQATVEPQPEIEEDSDCDIPEPQALESENHTPDEPNSEQEICDTELTENPSNTEDSESPTSQLSLPPFKEDLSNNISGLERKQTEATEQHKAPVEKNDTAGHVCFQFQKLFPEAKATDDWRFFGWATTKHSAEACIAQLEYMQEFRRQGHKIRNPRAFLRMALRANYQLPEYIMAKRKADESAEREKERYRKESEERRQMTANFSYESAAAALQELLDALD